MVLLGCRPEGRLTEQHDIFFGIAHSLKDLVPHMKASWPEAKGQIHIDSWREVTRVDNYKIKILPREKEQIAEPSVYLFFINLGGYKPGDFEEYHYKLITVAKDSATAIRQSKQTAFYRHTGLEEKGGAAHIDDKYGIDTDDIFRIDDVLPRTFKEKYRLALIPGQEGPEDPLHIGYIQLKKLLDA